MTSNRHCLTDLTSMSWLLLSGPWWISVFLRTLGPTACCCWSFAHKISKASRMQSNTMKRYQKELNWAVSSMHDAAPQSFGWEHRLTHWFQFKEIQSWFLTIITWEWRCPCLQASILRWSLNLPTSAMQTSWGFSRWKKDSSRLPPPDLSQVPPFLLYRPSIDSLRKAKEHTETVVDFHAQPALALS